MFCFDDGRMWNVSTAKRSEEPWNGSLDSLEIIKIRSNEDSERMNCWQNEWTLYKTQKAEDRWEPVKVRSTCCFEESHEMKRHPCVKWTRRTTSWNSWCPNKTPPTDGSWCVHCAIIPTKVNKQRFPAVCRSALQQKPACLCRNDAQPHFPGWQLNCNQSSQIKVGLGHRRLHNVILVAVWGLTVTRWAREDYRYDPCRRMAMECSVSEWIKLSASVVRQIRFMFSFSRLQLIFCNELKRQMRLSLIDKQGGERRPPPPTNKSN